MTGPLVDLDADDRDADWMKGGHGWPFGNTVIQLLERLRVRAKPTYVQKARIAQLKADSPWWSSIPPELEAKLIEAGLLEP